MIKRLLALLLPVVLCLTMGAAAFSDVNEDDWYCGQVEYVLQEGLMNGVSGDLFAPGWAVSRGMAVTVLYRMENSPAAGESASFPDVAGGEWYSDAVSWAQSTGLAAGYADGTFGPSDAVTREQLAVFLWRYAEYREMEIANGVLGGYRDADRISQWAVDGMKHAVGTGLITGKGGDLLDPGGTAVRAELAAVLQRLSVPASG